MAEDGAGKIGSEQVWIDLSCPEVAQCRCSVDLVDVDTAGVTSVRRPELAIWAEDCSGWDDSLGSRWCWIRATNWQGGAASTALLLWLLIWKSRD
ncbi:hypothetical protein Dimus_017690 [Dionaea muscipula]